MATLSSLNPTMLDLARATDPDGKIAMVAEVLAEDNEILDEMSWTEGNLTTGNRTTIRTGLPTPTWRKMYEGVAQTKSTTVQIDDSTGMLEAYAEIDKALADLNGNSAAFRFQEDRAHLQGMNHEVAQTMFYGNEGTEPEAFTGFSPRFNDTTAENGDNIVVGGGSGSDNQSIWMVVWGPQTCFGIVPKGSKAGLQVTDKGQVTVEDASNGSNTGRYEAYRTHYRWDVGLTVRDWRYVVRIPNIDVSDLTTTFTSGAFSSGANLPDLMFQAMRKVPNLSAGRPAFYMSRDIASWVARQKASLGLSSYAEAETVSGDKRWTERFQGIPMRRVDALSANEALVS